MIHLCAPSVLVQSKQVLGARIRGPHLGLSLLYPVLHGGPAARGLAHGLSGAGALPRHVHHLHVVAQVQHGAAVLLLWHLVPGHVPAVGAVRV